ncbi:lipopolysaccharide transport periplasmic protein LptA [Rhodanobacter fulvus Jip2]|uniref:Lipopolysaccharide export system protein LptA n=1 Tax=Rhodanobacter fulvus Jip2 TaxID=1163408 RepID=I4VKN5_9GAMM|nr:lipopolysaccharide transport periplasmic protein LptA [Rhodanobacter fulvus]EIL87776.1 lipopolysaccharide transport periplasmic protein LptA [Rhodanobacter fulvus Jip2]
MTSTPRSRRASASAAWLVLGLLALSPAFAKQSDRDQPMQVDAKHFDGFQKPNTVSTLTGSVVIRQGSLKATGAEAKVHFDGESQIDRVVITGNPAHLEQLDDNGNLMQGEAATIDYHAAKDYAVLSGNAVVKQKGRGEARGDTLTYNTQTSQMTGESNGDGMVHMTFQPKARAATTPADKPAAAAPAPASTVAPASARSSATPGTP